MKIIDVQNAQGQPIIIQHYVAIENMYVYMYAHICSIYFASHPVASKNKYSTYGHTYIHVCENTEDHGFSTVTWSTHHNTAFWCNRRHACIYVCPYMLNLLLPATLWQAKIHRAYMGIHI